MQENNSEIIPSQTIENRIYVIRGQKVMLDQDLASLYRVPTKRLKEQVKRNLKRFPADFMFVLTKEEFQNLRSQIATSSWGGTRYESFAFTEQGIAMLSTVLNSEQAIQVNIQIMRAFIKLKEMLLSNKELKEKIDKLESKYDNQFKNVFEAIRMLIDKTSKIERRITTEEDKPKKKYGFLSDR